MSYFVINTPVPDDIVSLAKANGFTVVDGTRTFNIITDGKYKEQVAREKRRNYYTRPEVAERRKAYMMKEDVKQKRKEYSKKKEVLERKKTQNEKKKKLINMIRSKDPQLYAEVMLSDAKQ